MKKKIFILIGLILILDQLFKIYIKTHFLLGEEVRIIGDWFRLNFIENEGMAFGLKLKGIAGKYVLSVFRIIAASAIMWYLLRIIREKQHPIFIYSIALIFAGAVGNIIDSMFYGIIFDSSSYWGSGDLPAVIFPEAGGYNGFLQGKVVDMLYFPMIHGFYPEWFPFYAGEEFMFFRPVFNLADSYISIGVILILIFQKRIFKIQNQKEFSHSVSTNSKIEE